MNLQISELSSLCWQQFGDEWVVFNEGCGAVIVAEPLTADLLTTLESGKIAQHVLVKRIAADFEIDDHGHLQSVLQERIDSLSKMGWIETEQE